MVMAASSTWAIKCCVLSSRQTDCKLSHWVSKKHADTWLPCAAELAIACHVEKRTLDSHSQETFWRHREHLGEADESTSQAVAEAEGLDIGVHVLTWPPLPTFPYVPAKRNP